MRTTSGRPMLAWSKCDFSVSSSSRESVSNVQCSPCVHSCTLAQLVPFCSGPLQWTSPVNDETLASCWADALQPDEEVDICAVYDMRSRPGSAGILLLDAVNPARELAASPFVLRALSSALLGPP